MLEGIDQQQEILVPQSGDDLLEHRMLGRLTDSELLGQRRQDSIVVDQPMPAKPSGHRLRIRWQLAAATA